MCHFGFNNLSDCLFVLDHYIDSQSVDSKLTSKGGFNQNAASSQRATGASLSAGNNAALISGSAISLNAANIEAKAGQASLIAAGPITIAGITTVQTQNSSSASRSSGFLSTKSSLANSSSTSALYEGSSIGGNTILVQPGSDVRVLGSSVVADKAVQINAAGNVTIEAATNKTRESSFSQTKESGLLSGGSGLSISIGSRDQSLDQQQTSTTAAASTVGSVTGNVFINAGQTYKQIGSDIITPGGNTTITAKQAEITEARQSATSATEQKFKQSGLTISISNPVASTAASAAQGAQSITQAASSTSSGRMQVLGAAAAGLTLYNAYNSLTDKAGNIDPAKAADITINVSLGSSKSQSNTASSSDSAKGSSVTAGGSVSITATGAGQDSNIVIQGASIQAGNSVPLVAHNQVNLLAARNESSQTSSNSSSSGSLGVSYSALSGVGVSASASKGKGNSDGQDTTAAVCATNSFKKRWSASTAKKLKLQKQNFSVR